MHSENFKTVSCKEKSYTSMKMNDNLHVIMRHMALTVVKELTHYYITIATMTATTVTHAMSVIL